jgi:hypothetical protein
MKNNANGNIICSSDKNLKEHILDLKTEDAISVNKVESIKLKSFNFKDEPNRRVYGVIAQDVQEAVLDDLVYTKEDGTLAVDYTSLLILKVAQLERYLSTAKVAIENSKNAREKVIELEKKIEELEKKLENK